MKNICFVHIPKCGGTSIRSGMKRSWLNLVINRKTSLDHPASALAAESYGKDILTYREELLRYFLFGNSSKYVFGHFKCTDETRRLFQENWYFITLLRDPVKRWLSHYYFDRYRTRNVHYNTSDLPIDRYLASKEGLQNARIYARHFSNYKIGEEITSQHVSDAVENILGFDVYGILENLESFAKNYKSKTGVSLKIKNKNKNPKKNYVRESISNELQQRVVELCQYDLQIYNQIKSRLSARTTDP